MGGGGGGGDCGGDLSQREHSTPAVAFAKAKGVANPVTTCFASSVDGADLLEVTQGVLVKEVHLTPLKDLRA